MKMKKNIAISESGFVFDPTSGDSFSLNPVGLEILNLLKDGKTQEEISLNITRRYDVETSAFEQYFLDFISMLQHHQILEADGEN